MKAEHHTPLMKGGGPAFPVHWQEDDGQHVAVGGMTLRDYFAGQALAAIFGGVGARDVADRDARYNETNWSEVVAANCYEMADAMLKARKP